MTRRGVRRIAGVMVAMGMALMAAPGPATAPRVAVAETPTPACGVVPAGTARCLGWFQPDALDGASAPASPPQGYGPADLRSAYALPAGGGAGRTVAVVDAFDDPTAEADMAVYRATFGLPPCTSTSGCFRRVDEHGGTQFPPADAGWAQEISLDLDMVSAICPGCRILLVEAAGADMPSLGTAEDTAAATPGVVTISNSFGSTERPDDIGWDQYFTHPGIAVVAASGDAGYGAVYPAASPLVTAVGGTTLTRTSGGRGWAETAWSSSGSGCSAYEPKPAWQHDAGCARRSIADVSAVADPRTGVAVYDGYQGRGWLDAGGTSAAAPIVASIYALAGNTAALTGASRAYANTAALNTVSSGSGSGLLCIAAFGCGATTASGYSGPTGLGSPNGLAAF